MSFFRYCVGVVLGVVLVFLYLGLFVWYVPRFYVRRAFMTAEQRRAEDEEASSYCLMDRWY